MEIIKYTPYRAFGWIVLKAECADGRTFTVSVDGDGPRTQSANFTLHTSGVLIARCLTDDLPMISQRTPGMSTKDLNPLRTGKFEFTANGDVRWWCVNWGKNDGKLPELEPVVIQSGDTRSFPIGTKLFICEGDSVVNGDEFLGSTSIQASTRPIDVVASSTVYGLMFV